MAMIMALCACPDLDVARRIGRDLVEQRLAACVQCVSGVGSIYRWQGQLCEETEVLLWIKTWQSQWQALEARILAQHPYELPEIIAVPVLAGYQPYLDWVANEVTGEQ